MFCREIRVRYDDESWLSSDGAVRFERRERIHHERHSQVVSNHAQQSETWIDDATLQAREVVAADPDLRGERRLGFLLSSPGIGDLIPYGGDMWHAHLPSCIDSSCLLSWTYHVYPPAVNDARAR